jgi:hypothetical protein
MNEITAECSWPPSAAARAAADRAKSCQRRLQQLRLRRPIERGDSSLARDHLARAQARAAAAEARRKLRTVRSAARVVTHGQSAGAISSTSPASTPLAGRLGRAGFPLSAVFDRYFALGGVCALFDIDAWAHGLMELPAGEHGILEHALWELTELGDE